jgi:hypothetical protein
MNLRSEQRFPNASVVLARVSNQQLKIERRPGNRVRRPVFGTFCARLCALISAGCFVPPCYNLGTSDQHMGDVMKTKVRMQIFRRVFFSMLLLMTTLCWPQAPAIHIEQNSVTSLELKIFHDTVEMGNPPVSYWKKTTSITL